MARGLRKQFRSPSRERLRSPGALLKRPTNRNASVSRGTLNFAVLPFPSTYVFRVGFIISTSSSLVYVGSKSNLRRKSKQNQEILGFLPLEKMAKAEVLICEEDFHPFSIFDDRKGKHVSSRGSLIEKKIDLLESEANKVSNRRSRRWLNDRLLIELVPRLNADEIRGLFAPPPWGDDTPLSPFCMTNIGEWDAFRNIDMDKEVSMIEDLRSPSTKRKGCIDTDKMAALDAWRRVDCRTRQALRRNFLSDIIEGYEECIRAFIKESGDGDVLMMHAQDPFHRLLLHGVCEFYDLVSVTVTKPKEVKVTRINKKKSGSRVIPNMTMTHFLKMAKDGSH